MDAMALSPDSERPVGGTTEEYSDDHHAPQDNPAAFGWHGEWGKSARIGGWITAVILVLMTTASHYNHAGTVWLLVFAAALVATLIWDMARRRNSWRK